jgi:integrase
MGELILAYIEKRETKDGTISYRVQVRMKGYPTQTATFNRITDAKKWAAQTEVAIREGRHFKTVEAKKHTVADLIDRYIKYVIPTKGSQASNQKAQLLWWRDRLGEYSLSLITPALIAEMRDELLLESTHQSARRSPSTVNRYLAAISHAFTVAMNEWGWVDENPLRKVTKPSEAEARVRFLSEDEQDRLLAACKKSRQKVLYPVVCLALATGMRHAEIFNLFWEHPTFPPEGGAWGIVDLARKRLVLYRTKNGSQRVLGITKTTEAAISLLNRTEGSPRLFPGKNADEALNTREAWTNALARAKIEDFRFHDLRHSSASYLVMDGASLAELAEILGHKTLQMVKRYAHLSDSHVAGVLEKMNKRFIG